MPNDAKKIPGTQIYFGRIRKKSCPKLAENPVILTFKLIQKFWKLGINCDINCFSKINVTIKFSAKMRKILKLFFFIIFPQNFHQTLYESRHKIPENLYFLCVFLHSFRNFMQLTNIIHFAPYFNFQKWISSNPGHTVPDPPKIENFELFHVHQTH